MVAKLVRLRTSATSVTCLMPPASQQAGAGINGACRSVPGACVGPTSCHPGDADGRAPAYGRPKHHRQKEKDMSASETLKAGVEATVAELQALQPQCAAALEQS